MRAMAIEENLEKMTEHTRKKDEDPPEIDRSRGFQCQTQVSGGVFAIGRRYWSLMGALKTRLYRYKSKIEYNLANIRVPIALGALGRDWNLARYVISTRYSQPACPTASTTVRSHGRF